MLNAHTQPTCGGHDWRAVLLVSAGVLRYPVISEQLQQNISAQAANALKNLSSCMKDWMTFNISSYKIKD